MTPNKVYLSIALLIFLTMILWITSCSHDAKIPDMPEICFEGDILPIFQNSCAITDCHDGQGESDLILNNYPDIRDYVVSGRPYSSKIYKAIITATGEKKMPPDQPLSIDNRTLIRFWIEQGAGWTVCPETTAIDGDDDPFVNPPAVVPGMLPIRPATSSNSEDPKSELIIEF